jgi:hypothetical protein
MRNQKIDGHRDYRARLYLSCTTAMGTSQSTHPLHTGMSPASSHLHKRAIVFSRAALFSAMCSLKTGVSKHSAKPLRDYGCYWIRKIHMQELPESVQSMVGSVYAMLMKGGEEKQNSDDLPQNAANACSAPTAKLLERLVGPAGFEPTTSTV